MGKPGNQKGIQAIEAVLEAARIWAIEHIDQRYTGTMIIEIGFLDGGVRTPTVKETRVFRAREPKG